MINSSDVNWICNLKTQKIIKFHSNHEYNESLYGNNVMLYVEIRQYYEAIIEYPTSMKTESKANQKLHRTFISNEPIISSKPIAVL